MGTADDIYDVLILGYGPVGATFANILGQAGHKVAVADMHREIYDKPRAINLDQDALRLLQRIGLADEISAGCEPHTGTDFLGLDGKPIKSIYSAPPPYPMGWPANLMFIQPEAERRLRDRVATLSTIDVYLEHMAVRFDQDADNVAVTFDTGQGQATLRARYLIGCDGANSPTRAWMGVSQTDMAFSQHYVVVDAWLTRDTPLPPRTSHFCWPDAPTSYVINSGNLRRWEMKIPPREDPQDYHDLEKVKARLAPFVDVDALKFWRSAVYHFDARVADAWRDKRAFIAGDAAHTMPPFLGQGLNSGLRDVANLSWKLSYVLQGRAPETLLDTYQLERRANVSVVVEISKGLGEIIGEMDPEKARERDARLRQEMAEHGAVTIRQALIPPIQDGFLDPQGGELAGVAAPQPSIRTGGEHRLLDDLLSGFSLVSLGDGAGTLEVTNDVETDDPVVTKLQETDALLSGFMTEHAVTAMIIRPDGVIWSTDPDHVGASQRLRRAFNLPVPETSL